MSGIFGIFNRDGSPVEPSRLAAMRDAMDYWGPDGFGLWVDGCAALGQSRFFSFPEARHENLPLVDSENGLVFTAEGRVDNRTDLGRQLGIPTSRFDKLPDSEFIRQAYLRWGKDCVGCIYGDWSFAVWHPKERRLFLARDHFGITSLYHYAGEEVFAFASSRKALLSLNLAPVELDELYLGQILVSWFAYHGERTIHKPIRRLPPAHTLTITPASLDKCIYWRLEDTQPLRLKKREDYVAAFLEVWDEAVRARLRAVGPIACAQQRLLDDRPRKECQTAGKPCFADRPNGQYGDIMVRQSFVSVFRFSTEEIGSARVIERERQVGQKPFKIQPAHAGFGLDEIKRYEKNGVQR